MADIQDQSHQEHENSECLVGQIKLQLAVGVRFYLEVSAFGLPVCFWGW